MKLYKNPAREDWNEIIRRPTKDYGSIEKQVRKILKKVKGSGDKAVKKFTKEFDGISRLDIKVTEQEINQAAASISPELKLAIQQAKENIERFHTTQKDNIIRTETMPGIQCWRRAVPIGKVGLYIPGGTAPLFSTVLMLGVPASIAGCPDIILCTPALRDGSVHPAILYTAQLCGISAIFKVGGAQAIGAMSYGTETIPAVYKIFGPGNSYVTIAKQLVQQEGIAIDMPAGPSEVLVLADETAVPAFVAADLLSQAEHGPDSQALLVTTSKILAVSVMEEIDKQVLQLPRKDITAKSLKHARVILLKDLETSMELVNLYAPEHLIIACSDAEGLAGQVKAAGSVFIGNYSPETAGDYASGTNHTLPTNGYAAMYSGVSLDSFVNKISFQQLSFEGLSNLAKTIITMAEAEGLEAHRNSVAIRLKK